MAAEISIHDNFLLSYMVDSSEQRITLHTAFFDQEPYEFTDVVFTGVLAYHFEGDFFCTILFDITETPPPQIYTAYQDLFERLKNQGWPGPDYKTPEELIEQLTTRNIRAFDLHSSYGMYGFVLAQEMRREAVPDTGIRPVNAGFPLPSSNL